MYKKNIVVTEIKYPFKVSFVTEERVRKARGVWVTDEKLICLLLLHACVSIEDFKKKFDTE